MSSCNASICSYREDLAFVDACGVCLGDNSTCAGCDGVPNSGAATDECGTCGGDGSGCVLMARELISIFWFAFLFAFSVLLLWILLPSFVSRPRRRRIV